MSPLPSGTRIGSYEVLDKLGEGGMGEVYRARDTRLDRSVALKVLPPLFTSDPERIARFEREARVLAQLNHPNIAQVYGFEPPSSGTAAIAMELVEGPTLDDLIREAHAGTGTGLPFDQALAIARQIAVALEVAHDQGIIHRDLKPANIKVREDGTVKVLDFGLAKAFAADAEAQQSAVANSPTLTAHSALHGLIIGTAAYMSPEQARGRQVDRRADVWAFGVVFFEMLAGRRAFEGEDVSDVLASVLKSEPDWALLPADLPAPARRLLRRCLEKDPKKRLRDIAEGMLQLDEGLASGSGSSAITGVRAAGFAAQAPWWKRAAPIAATAAATALIVLGIAIWRAPEPERPVVVRSSFVTPASAPLLTTVAARDVALSPDGRILAYNAGPAGTPNPTIYLRPLDQLEGTPLRGARGIGPFFSPDGQWVGFIPQSAGGELRKVPALGGSPVPVTSVPTPIVGAVWTAEGIFFGTRGAGLFRVSEEGGDAVPLTTLGAGEAAHAWPSAVPGTNIVLFGIVAAPATPPLIGELAAVDRQSGDITRLGIRGTCPRYLSTGHLLYADADGSVRAAPFDLERLEGTGAPAPVLHGVGIKQSGGANFDLSTNGHLAYSSAGTSSARRGLVWVDRSGRETPIAAPIRNYFYARISPDGTRLSLDSRDQGQDIWIWDLTRESIARLTDTPGADQYGLWTPDQRIVFNSAARGGPELFSHRPDGVGDPMQISDLSADRLQPFPNAITPDGRHVIFRAVRGPGHGNDLFIVEMTGDRKPRPLVATEHEELNADVSPDGKYIVFESDVSGGRLEVFLRPFPNVDDGQIKVSIDGGQEPAWSADGREIFYLADRRMVSVPVTYVDGTIRLGKPTELFDADSYFFGGAGRNYDVAKDGQRFVMVKTVPEDRNRSVNDITLVVNWIEELRARIK